MEGGRENAISLIYHKQEIHEHAEKEIIKRKRWDYRGDSIYKRSRSWVLAFPYKGRRSILTERLA